MSIVSSTRVGNDGLILFVLDLLHEVSLRESSNRMNAHNLAVVICPNLIKGPDPLKDIAMCVIPSGPSAPTSRSTEAKTSLGSVIKYCIQHYYEVFDEVQDRSEATPVQRRPQVLDQQPPSPDRRYSGFQNEDDEEIDDAMLVMPIGPAAAPSKDEKTPTSLRQEATSSGTVPYKTRVRSPKPPPGAGGRSFHTAGENGNGAGASTIGRSKSLISIDNGNGNGNMGTRRGSISIGRGTTRKSSGAGVEAIGITAGGFFTAPNSAPPVPSFPSDDRR